MHIRFCLLAQAAQRRNTLAPRLRSMHPINSPKSSFCGHVVAGVRPHKHSFGACMYVQIHSRRDDSPEHGGKTSWVNSGKPSFVAMRKATEHLGKPAWHIQVTALGKWELSSGERSGIPKNMNKTALHQLMAEDLEAIARIAVAEGLLSPKSCKVFR